MLEQAMSLLKVQDLLFSIKSKRKDYHDSMDNESFKKWLCEKFRPMLIVSFFNRKIILKVRGHQSYDVKE